MEPIDKVKTPMIGCWSLIHSYSGCFWALDECHAETADDARSLLTLRYGASNDEVFVVGPVMIAYDLWQRTKYIYNFEPELAQSMTNFCDVLDLDDDPTPLPLPCLTKMPVSCVYVKAPGQIAPGVDGFLAHVKGQTLNLVFVSERMNEEFPCSVSLKDEPLLECMPDVEKIFKNYFFNASKFYEGVCPNMVAKFLTSSIQANYPSHNPLHNACIRACQMLLYVISIEADVSEPASMECEKEPQKRYHKDGTVIRSNERTATTESGPNGTIFFVGNREIHNRTHTKSDEQPEDHPSRKSHPVTGHIRRGHWHRYWVKNEKGKKELVPRWVNQCEVGDQRTRKDKVSVINMAEKQDKGDAQQ